MMDGRHITSVRLFLASWAGFFLGTRDQQDHAMFYDRWFRGMSSVCAKILDVVNITVGWFIQNNVCQLHHCEIVS